MKAVLVLNEMPKGCLIGCPCCVKEDDNNYHCVGKDNRNIQHFYDDGYCGKPNWCPIKPMPYKKIHIGKYNVWKIEEEDKETLVENRGYNKCIDEILGETE